MVDKRDCTSQWIVLKEFACVLNASVDSFIINRERVGVISILFLFLIRNTLSGQHNLKAMTHFYIRVPLPVISPSLTLAQGPYPLTNVID